MSDLRIDLSDMKARLATLRRAAGPGRGSRPGDEERMRSAARLALRAFTATTAVALLPFVVLIRGGVHAYRGWGLGTWPSLLLAVLATAAVLAGYAWLAGRYLGSGARMHKRFMHGAVGVTVAYVVYTLLFVATANVTSDAVRAEYRSLHPLLRIASSALVLVDADVVITDAGRTPEDYRLMGLPPNEASLHYEQEDGYVHALDLRTTGRGEVRNRLVELAFWTLGFHSLRHVGTADHLHVSLRMPE